MPFFDDSGTRPEEHHGPFFNTFALLLDQIERMIALNIVWSIQLIPAILAFAFPSFPIWGRALLWVYTAVAIVPATGLVYKMVASACDGELLNFETGKELLRQGFLPSLLTLFPLYSIFGWLVLLAILTSGKQWFIINVGIQVLFLLTAVCSIYWGPLFVEKPNRILDILKTSVRMVWGSPSTTSITGFFVLLAIALGLISVGGLFLIVPVFVALLEIQVYRYVMTKSKKGY